MNVEETEEAVYRLQVQLSQIYDQYGTLCHPEVVKASQELDQALNEMELQKVRDQDLESA